MTVDTPSGPVTSSRISEVLLSQVRKYADELSKPISRHCRKVKGRTLRIRKDRLKQARAATKVRRLEGVLAVGNWLYGMVRLVEKNWRTEVIEGKTLYEPREEASIMHFYREWSAPCERCIDEIDQIRSTRSRVEGAEQFKSHCAEAKRILAGESPFFDDVNNASRWAAVTAFLRPNVRPVRIDEDGRIFEMSGEQLHIPGLEPADVLEALEDEREGRLYSLDEVVG